jgi:hypothetical protein
MRAAMDPAPSNPQPASRRAVTALLGALPLLAIVAGLFIYNRQTRSQLAVIKSCLHCSAVGQPVESGWVEVQPGDAWAVALGPSSGMLVLGPARFEVAGKERVAISRGRAFLAAGASGRAVVLLPRDPSQGVEGATVATDAAQSRVALQVAPEGNRVEVLAGRAALALGSGNKAIATGESWQSGKTQPLPAPSAEESRHLQDLAGAP